MSKYNYFRVVNVDGYAFPVAPQVSFNFNSQGFSLLNRGIHIVQYSFDGETLHGDMDPGDPSRGSFYDYRYESKIWFRCVDGYGSVRVEAWSPA